MSADQNETTPVTTTSAANRRLDRRRPLKKGVGLTVRKGTMGLGLNIAIEGIELSGDGMQVRLKSELKVEDEVEISLVGIGRSKPMVITAEVRWCRPDENGNFLAGFEFRKRLTYADLGQFI